MREMPKKCLLAGMIVLLLSLLLAAASYADPKYCPYDIWNSTFYRHLNSTERKLADDLYDAARLGEKRVDIPQGCYKANDEFWVFFRQFYYEFQELSAIDYTNCLLYSTGGTPNYLEYAYQGTIEEQDEFIGLLEKLAKRMYSVKDVHDYLKDRLRYDYSGLRAEQKGKELNRDLRAAYDCLHTKKAVCAGYAGAFAAICHFSGIEASYISGMGDGGSHAWNIARDGDTYTLVDVTWDDTARSSKWFCVSTKQMAKDHTPNANYSWLPTCYSAKGTSKVSKTGTKATAKPTPKPTPKPTARPTAGPTSQPTPQPQEWGTTVFTLRKGDSGDEVRALQKRLKELGFLKGSVDGDYGSQTAEAVELFQKNNGIHGNSSDFGIATRLTQMRLNSSRAVKKGGKSPVQDGWSMKAGNEPYVVFTGEELTVSGRSLSLRFRMRNENTSRRMVAFTVRYWLEDSKTRLVKYNGYDCYEVSWTGLSLSPGETQWMTLNAAESSDLGKAARFRWVITEVEWDNGEVYMYTDLSGRSLTGIGAYTTDMP